MLLPAQIQGHQFQMSRGMYKAVEVDAFLNEIYASYEQMFRENGDLIKKLELLATRVEEYRKDEDNIRIALLTAQRMADQITKEAKQSAGETTANAVQEAQTLERQSKQKATAMLENAEQTAKATVEKANAVAQSTLSQARLESERIIGGVKKDVVTQQAILDGMKKEVSEFRGKLMSMYKEHIERINEMPSYTAPQPEEAAPAYEPEPAAPQPQAVEAAPVVEEPEEVLEAEEEHAEIYEEAPVTEEPAEETPPAPAMALRELVNEAYADVEKEKTPEPQKPEYKAKGAGFQVRMDSLEETEHTHTLPKFQDLKFGENYDISADADEDDDKARKGFFRKK